MGRFLKITATVLLAVVLATPAMAADAAAGAKAFKQACGVCHALATSGVGPALGGLSGARPAPCQVMPAAIRRR